MLSLLMGTAMLLLTAYISVIWTADRAILLTYLALIVVLVATLGIAGHLAFAYVVLLIQATAVILLFNVAYLGKKSGPACGKADQSLFFPLVVAVGLVVLLGSSLLHLTATSGLLAAPMFSSTQLLGTAAVLGTPGLFAGKAYGLLLSTHGILFLGGLLILVANELS